MGLLTAIEIVPFVLFSLSSGVWLDRVRKLAVYVGGARWRSPCRWPACLRGVRWATDHDLHILRGVRHRLPVHHGGTAAQIVLTQGVSQLAAGRSACQERTGRLRRGSGGPRGVAGALIRLVGAPAALLADAVVLIVLVLRGLDIRESPGAKVPGRFWKGRMNSTMRWMILIPVLPGAMLGGWRIPGAAVGAGRRWLRRAGLGAAWLAADAFARLARAARTQRASALNRIAARCLPRDAKKTTAGAVVFAERSGGSQASRRNSTIRSCTLRRP